MTANVEQVIHDLLRAERDAAVAALQRVRELHERTSFEVERRAYCVHCQLVAGVWPCPTIKALEGEHVRIVDRSTNG